MQVNRLPEKGILDPETEIHYALHTQLSVSTITHRHEFFEIFLLTQGSVYHLINGNETLLTDGTIVFIRPDDAHSYKKLPEPDNNLQLINLAFSQKTFYALMNYFEEEGFQDKFINPTNPPSAYLSPKDKEYLYIKLINFNTIPLMEKRAIKTALKTLLVEIFYHYFLSPSSNENQSIPPWLNKLCNEMQKKENFTSGISIMQKLAARSPEYLCRVFNKYFAKTPTGYINELRLNYAANLLVNTDHEILDICLEVGFDNVSHFYHLFHKHYGQSPAKFRKAHQKMLIPT